MNGKTCVLRWRTSEPLRFSFPPAAGHVNWLLRMMFAFPRESVSTSNA